MWHTVMLYVVCLGGVVVGDEGVGVHLRRVAMPFTRAYTVVLYMPYSDATYAIEWCYICHTVT